MWWKLVILWNYLWWRGIHYLLNLLGVGVAVKRDGYYQLDYYYGTEKYSIRFPLKKEISFYRFYEDSEDVTSQIKPFMGVSKNFHGIPVTPRMLGYSSLMVSKPVGRKGTEANIFEKDQPIQL